MYKLSFSKHVGIAGLICSSLVLVACDTHVTHSTAKTQLQITHAKGTTAVPEKPEHVVVFDTSSLDSLTLLGFPVSAVPQSSVTYPAFLQHYSGSDFYNAGTLFEPNFEELSARQPELIIAGGRSRDAYDELSKIAPTLDLSLDTTDISASLHQQVRTLGQIYGQQAKAEQLLTEFDQRLATVRAKSEQAGTAMVVMVVGNRLSAYGTGSRFGFIFDGLGFKPAGDLESKGLHGNPMPFELLLKTDPDWLFVLSRDVAIGQDGAASAAKVLDNEIVNKTKAMQQGNVIYLDSSAVYLAGGLNTYFQLLEQVEQALTAK